MKNLQEQENIILKQKLSEMIEKLSATEKDLLILEVKERKIPTVDVDIETEPIMKADVKNEEPKILTSFSRNASIIFEPIASQISDLPTKEEDANLQLENSNESINQHEQPQNAFSFNFGSLESNVQLETKTSEPEEIKTQEHVNFSFSPPQNEFEQENNDEVNNYLSESGVASNVMANEEEPASLVETQGKMERSVVQNSLQISAASTKQEDNSLLQQGDFEFKSFNNVMSESAVQIEKLSPPTLTLEEERQEEAKESSNEAIGASEMQTVESKRIPAPLSNEEDNFGGSSPEPQKNVDLSEEESISDEEEHSESYYGGSSDEELAPEPIEEEADYEEETQEEESGDDEEYEEGYEQYEDLQEYSGEFQNYYQENNGDLPL